MNKKQKIILSSICLIIELVIGYLFIGRLYEFNNLIFNYRNFYVFVNNRYVIYTQLACLVCLFINVLSIYICLFFIKNLELIIKKNKYLQKLQIPFIVVSSIVSVIVYIFATIPYFNPYFLIPCIFLPLLACVSITFFLYNIIVRCPKQKIVLTILCLMIELVVLNIILREVDFIKEAYLQSHPGEVNISKFNLNIRLTCIICLFFNVLILYTHLFFRKNTELIIKKNKYLPKLQISYIVVSSISSIVLYLIFSNGTIIEESLEAFVFISILTGASITYFLINFFVSFAKKKIILSILCLIIELLLLYIFLIIMYSINNKYQNLPLGILITNGLSFNMLSTCIICLFFNVLTLYTYLFFKKNLELKIKKNRYLQKVEIPYIVVSSISGIVLYLIFRIVKISEDIMQEFVVFIYILTGISILFLIINVIFGFAKKQKNFENKNI